MKHAEVPRCARYAGFPVEWTEVAQVVGHEGSPLAARERHELRVGQRFATRSATPAGGRAISPGRTQSRRDRRRSRARWRSVPRHPVRSRRAEPAGRPDPRRNARADARRCAGPPRRSAGPASAVALASAGRAPRAPRRSILGGEDSKGDSCSSLKRDALLERGIMAPDPVIFGLRTAARRPKHAPGRRSGRALQPGRKRQRRPAPSDCGLSHRFVKTKRGHGDLGPGRRSGRRRRTGHLVRPRRARKAERLLACCGRRRTV